MTIKDFEELEVFTKARGLSKQIYRLTGDGIFARDYGLTDQMRRSNVSIMSNIAEGFERGSNPEFIQFLYVARGSCGEIRAQLMIALDQGYINRDAYHSIIDICKDIARMINGLIKYLKNSDIKKRNK